MLLHHTGGCPLLSEIKQAEGRAGTAQEALVQNCSVLYLRKGSKSLSRGTYTMTDEEGTTPMAEKIEISVMHSSDRSGLIAETLQCTHDNRINFTYLNYC